MFEVTVGLLLLFSLIFLANWADGRGDERLQNIVHWLLLLVNLPVFFLGLSLLIAPAGQMEEATFGLSLADARGGGLVFLLTGVWGLLVMLAEVRRFFARWIPLDPGSSVHVLSLILGGYLVGLSAINLVQGGPESILETNPSSSVTAAVAQQLLFVALALAGVGLFVRREGWKLMDRLGLDRPTRRQLLFGLGVVAIFLALQWLAGVAFMLLDPSQAEVLDDLNTQLLSEFDTVGEWLLIAVSSSVGEELLFRGALQPVFGLWPTAFLFAFAHVQYGITPITAFVFIFGLVLGFTRQRTNTTVAVFIHFCYNFALGLASVLASSLT